MEVGTYASPYHKRHLDWFSCFNTAHGCDRHRHGHTQTDHATFVAVSRIASTSAAMRLNERYYETASVNNNNNNNNKQICTAP